MGINYFPLSANLVVSNVYSVSDYLKVYLFNTSTEQETLSVAIIENDSIKARY